MMVKLEDAFLIRKMAGAAAVALALLGISANASDAKDYPSAPVKVVIPFAAGGPADLAGRAFAQHLATELGGTVVVENRGGGGGIIALNTVSNSAPDGLTLLFAASGNVTVQPLLANPTIKINERLRPIASVTTSPHGLFVTAKLPVNNLEELISYAKANPGKLNFATPGVGGLGHLGIEYLKSAAGIDAQTIHYKGAAPAVQDMLSGQVHATLSSTASLQGMVDQGTLKLVGLTGPTQAASLKNVPLISSKVPGFDYTTWYGFFAPKGTPDAVIDKINQALLKAKNQQKLVENLRAQGIDVAVSSPAELDKLVAQDTDKWQKVISATGISLK